MAIDFDKIKKLKRAAKQRNAQKYRDIYKDIAGKGTIVTQDNDNKALYAGELDEVTVRPSNYDKGERFGKEVINSTNETGKQMAPILGGMMIAPFAIGGIAANIPATIGGMIGDAATQGIVRGTTKYDSWGDMLHDKTGLHPFLAELVNPGAWAGGIAAKPIVNGVKSIFPKKSTLDWKTWSKSSQISKDLLKEYLNIENTFKGTKDWLKMPDGSYWQGDPRAWIQMQSNKFKSTFKEPTVIYHGSPNGQITEFKTPGSIGYERAGKRSTGDGGIYTSPNKSYADRYQADNLMTEHIPEGAKTYTLIGDLSNMYDAGGKSFINLDGITMLPSKLTNENVILLKSKGYNGIKNFYPRKNKPEHIFFNSSDIKSLEGNNGNFDISNSNIFKLLSGVTLGLGTYSLQNNTNNVTI